uniref:(northern house mosquito) hypothetical protein n=1 Tax=Culex pipiens TaxID=7175 RepID=A0A8D8AMV1_CULPI
MFPNEMPVKVLRTEDLLHVVTKRIRDTAVYPARIRRHVLPYQLHHALYSLSLSWGGASNFEESVTFGLLGMDYAKMFRKVLVQKPLADVAAVRIADDVATEAATPFVQHDKLANHWFVGFAIR